MSPYTLLALVFVGLAVGPILVTAQASRSSYGESCNATHRCSKRDWLRCNNGICDCIKPDIMIFEKASDFDTLPSMAASGTGRCSIKVGERCRFNLGSDESGTSVLDVFPCSMNSVCDSDGFCTCHEGYYENWNGTCAKFQEFMQPCNAELKCKSEFRCHDNLCRCESNSLSYSYKVNKCVGLAGMECNEGDCIENATCSRSNTCICNNGFYVNEENRCSPQLDYGFKCTSDEQCGHDRISNYKLLCVQGKCGCDSTVSHFSTVGKHRHDYYNDGEFIGFEEEKFSFCAPKPNNACPDLLCAVKSYCEYSRYTSGNDGICACMQGTSVSRLTGLCAINYNGQCTSANDECADGLVCRTPGRCQCRNSRQRYDSVAKRCVSKVNDPCNEDADCENNAHCGTNGRCQCNDGFILDGARDCVASFNTTCGYGNGACDSAAGLFCMQDRCACEEVFVYSERLRKCVGGAGAPCDIQDLRPGAACVSNATCKYSRNFYVPGRADITGFCKCDKGFVEASDYTCVLQEALSTEASLVMTTTEEDQDKLAHAPKLTTERVQAGARGSLFALFTSGDSDSSE